MSTLQDWHDRHQAEWQDYSGIPIVSTYGRVPLEYAAFYRSAAVMDMSHRGVLRIAGADRFQFLNNVLSAAVVSRETGQPLPEREATFAFLLDRKGRIQAEMNVVRMGEHCLLEMDRRLLETVWQELEKYHFREKVEVSRAEELAVVGVFGPAAGKMTGSLGAESWRDDLGGVAGRLLAVNSRELAALWEKLSDGVPVGWAAFNAVRIEAFRPMLGIDYDSSFLPGETGQVGRGVSFNKGCYPGQEIVARMQSRDQLARRVTLLTIAGGELPISGEKVFDGEGNQVGAITSSTLSPRQSSASLSLAILKKPWFEPGTVVKIPAEGALRNATVS